jgi:GAF domain-containing protein
MRSMTEDLATKTTTILDRLLTAVVADRVTLRQMPEKDFPVTAEALAPGVASVKDVRRLRPDNSPTLNKILRTKTIVIQNDCRASMRTDSDNSSVAFKEMLDTYGGLGAFIVLPLFRQSDDLFALLSIHHLGGARVWTTQDIGHVTQAGAQIRKVVEGT